MGQGHPVNKIVAATSCECPVLPAQPRTTITSYEVCTIGQSRRLVGRSVAPMGRTREGRNGHTLGVFLQRVSNGDRSTSLRMDGWMDLARGIRTDAPPSD